MKIYKSNKMLSVDEFCKSINLQRAAIKSIERFDFFDASLNNFKAYEYSLWKILTY